MLKILSVVSLVFNLLAVIFVIIGRKYHLGVKEGDKNKNLYYKKFRLYSWIGLSLFFISMILSAVFFYQSYL